MCSIWSRVLALPAFLTPCLRRPVLAPCPGSAELIWCPLVAVVWCPVFLALRRFVVFRFVWSFGSFFGWVMRHLYLYDVFFLLLFVSYGFWYCVCYADLVLLISSCLGAMLYHVVLILHSLYVGNMHGMLFWYCVSCCSATACLMLPSLVLMLYVTCLFGIKLFFVCCSHVTVCHVTFCSDTVRHLVCLALLVLCLFCMACWSRIMFVMLSAMLP